MICRSVTQGENKMQNAQEARKASEEATQTAGYIEEMVGQMEALAGDAGLDSLRFMLARAREEAKRATA